MTTPTEKLLPCPFCGGEATIGTPWPSGDEMVIISCRQCRFSTGSSGYKEKGLAVTHWNTRVHPTPAQPSTSQPSPQETELADILAGALQALRQGNITVNQSPTIDEALTAYRAKRGVV